MITPHGWVSEFREAAGTTDTGPEARARCWGLLREEIVELKHELDHGNKAGIARELADLIYMAYDTALTHQIYLDDAVKEIHRSNMAKRFPDGTFHRDEETGKVLKPDRWSPPLMDRALRPRPVGSVVIP